jgi:Family of unknown function (DUF6088)
MKDKYLLRKIKTFEDATVFCPDDFPFSNLNKVQQELLDLVELGEISNIVDNFYIKKITGIFGDRWPNVEEVMENYSLKTNQTLVRHGAVAANYLGLSTQVPMKYVYYTSRADNLVKIGKFDVRLDKSLPYLLLPGFAGVVIRALDYLGPDNFEHNMIQILTKLSIEDLHFLKSYTILCPEWLKTSILTSIK